MTWGHEAVRAAFRPRPGRSYLLHGPWGVGKRTAALEVAGEHAHPLDVLELEPLSAEGAREAAAFAAQAPIGGRSRAVVAGLDGASAQAQNALLKALEEPPPTAMFLCVASGEVLPTIRSRCELVRFSALTPEVVAAVLLAQGVTADDAEALAPACGGSVGRALALRPAIAERARVLSLLKAVSSRDWTLTARLLRASGEGADRWGEAGLLAFRLWAADALAGTELFYSRAERFGLDRSVPRRALVRAAAAAGTQARPSLAIALAVDELLARRF